MRLYGVHSVGIPVCSQDLGMEMAPFLPCDPSQLVSTVQRNPGGDIGYPRRARRMQPCGLYTGSRRVIRTSVLSDYRYHGRTIQEPESLLLSDDFSSRRRPTPGWGDADLGPRSPIPRADEPLDLSLRSRIVNFQTPTAS